MRPAILGAISRPVEYQYESGSFVNIADGNSLTAGTGASGPAFYWPALANGLPPLAGLGVTPINVAVGGQGIATTGSGGPASTMMSRAAAQVDANTASGKMSVLVAWEFTNEVKYLAGDGTTAHANMRAYCLARKAAAAAAGKALRIIVVTAVPALYASQTQGTINAWNAGLHAANQLMRAQFQEYADVLADVAGAEPFASLFANGVFTAAAFDSVGLYSNDRVHLNDTGYAFVAQVMSAAYKRVQPYSDQSNPVTSGATGATISIYRSLKNRKYTKQYAFGTNDMLSTMPPTTLAFYGTAGVFQANSGKYPGCVGFEYHDEEWTSRYGATATAATKTAIQAAHAAGAIILLHHHAGNPVTGALSAEGTLSTFNNPFGQAGETGNVYDRDGSPVAAIKTGGAQEAQFLAYLDRLATFLASLTDAGGNLIPVIFRPFHECNGNWFWWNGTDRAADLILVWQKMVAYLRDTKGVTNVLYCWNVDAGPGSIGSFWPGPTYVDVISMDVYDNTANSTASLARQGTTVTAYNDLVSRAAAHSKPLIFAEVGYSYGAQNISDIWDVKTGDILTASFPQCSLLAVWRSPFGPGSSDSASIKTSLTNMANSPEALTAGEV